MIFSTGILMGNFNFLWTGIAQNLLSFDIDRKGIGKYGENNLLAAAQPLGAVLLTVLVGDNLQKLARIGFFQVVKRYWHFAVLDLIGVIFSQLSIALIGSGIFTVIYSSIVVYIACLSKYQFNSNISSVRWTALIIIVCSVILSSFGQIEGKPSTGNEEIRSDYLAKTFMGILFAFASTISYGSLYVLLSEEFKCREYRYSVLGNRRKASDELPGDSSSINVEYKLSQTCLLLAVSGIETFICCVYFVFVVLPHWTIWVSEPVRVYEKGGEFDEIEHIDNVVDGDDNIVLWIILQFVLVTFISGFHLVAFYYCTSFGKAAAVSSGVNKALQAAILFVVSHLLYCSPTYPEQCMNGAKMLGTIGVCVGVLLYAFDTQINTLLSRTSSDSIYEERERGGSLHDLVGKYESPQVYLRKLEDREMGEGDYNDDEKKEEKEQTPPKRVLNMETKETKSQEASLKLSRSVE
eukprot:g5990.t1